MKKLPFFRLILSLSLPLAVGYIGSMVTTPAIDGWYATLNRPSFAPPNWLFAPVWTGLFLLMGLAFFLVWNTKIKKNAPKKQLLKKEALLSFITQLIFNFIWSYLFFGQQLLWTAFIEILVLWILIANTIISFEKIKPLAAYLMIPYILWVSFAAMLNFSFALIN